MVRRGEEGEEKNLKDGDEAVVGEEPTRKSKIFRNSGCRTLPLILPFSNSFTIGFSS